ncbi:MAG: hypothetical protein ACOCUI_00075, partial [bacterium]
FTADILKLKMFDYRDKKIAEQLGELYRFKIDKKISSSMTKKSEIVKYIKKYMKDEKFFKKHNYKFHIISRNEMQDEEEFFVSSCLPSQINSAIERLKKDRKKVEELFVNSLVPNV